MLKIKRYLKPYITLLLGAVMLLFGQAMLELTLPNYMSDIVNVGLQQGGITYSAPKAIDAQSMQMIQMFMSEEDKAAAQGAYTQLEAGDLAELQKTYPNLQAGDYAMLGESSEQVESAFSRASYAMVLTIKQMADKQGIDSSSSSKETSIDPQVMEQMMMALRQPAMQEQIQSAISEAAVTPETMISQTGPVLVKSFYRALGADTDAIQTNYILMDGLKMLGLTVLLTSCAIAAGFCLSRLGAGVGRDLRRDVFSKVTNFNNSEMDQFSTASLITRSTNDITQIQNFLSMGFRMMCFAQIGRAHV